jgi:Asp-tRNA(Asn)/Glu-tRNA(Gln) amidotransferase A subunit family amidase
VAGSIQALPVGTDSGGSVRIPASYTGCYGFRPTHAVVTVSGVKPFAKSFDTVGWFARDPVVLANVGKTLLKVTAAKVGNDGYCSPSHRMALSSISRCRYVGRRNDRTELHAKRQGSARESDCRLQAKPQRSARERIYQNWPINEGAICDC